MAKDILDRFGDIQLKAIREAEAIDCDLQTFLHGLKAMAEELNDRIDGVSHEVEQDLSND